MIGFILTNNEILRAIVASVAIDMMNLSAFGQFLAKSIFSNPDMIRHPPLVYLRYYVARWP